MAVKELRPPGGLAGADLEIHQRRALREAGSAARIQHPNAVTLYEAIPAAARDDAVYLIMERDGGIGLWNTGSRSSTTLKDTSAGVYATGGAFSPNGGTLAIAYGSGVKLLDVATRSWTGNLPLTGRVSGLRTLLFTPSGDTLAAARAAPATSTYGMWAPAA